MTPLERTMSNLSGLTDVRTLAIEELSFSVRLYNALKRHGTHTVGDLVALSDIDIVEQLGCTMREVHEAEDKLRLVNTTCGTSLYLRPDFRPDFYDVCE
jgi:DNA-directed RNA polymerase alpha subunit